MAVDPMRANQLFEVASKLASPEERAALLDRECAGDAELRAQVEAMLLDAADRPGVSISTSVRPDLSTDTGQSQSPLVGIILAEKYKLIERIGEGGMGIVWLAQQSTPVRRKVAVKLIKLGMDSRQVIGRFEAERQALAMMDHPNIARVLDGGISPDGRPFFVMELVKGMPITKYCDTYKLSLKERLDLFIPVCQAIQHAHQKGIIHRDIKPGNVLIALYDDHPVPKVIDFGVAKATGQSLTELTLNTGFGGVVGTPQYMSPEQATLNNLDIDTRTDVYSLGILLYELLAGSPPFAKQELEKRGLLEMLRVVREEEPPKPSTRLSSADALPSLSANRSIEPRKLTQMLRSELDWVVLKAIEKNRARRYDTASGFAADISRYLAGEPVHAHPPSTTYRLRKYISRHRSQVVAVSLIAFALLASVAGLGYGFRQAIHARQRAEADDKRFRESIAERDAERNAKLAATNQASELSVLFKEVFQGPYLQRGTVTVAQLVDGASKNLELHFATRPDLKAEIQADLGNFAYALGFTQQAVSLQEKVRNYYLSATGPDSSATLEAVNHLAFAYDAANRRPEAQMLWQDVLDRSRRLYGPEEKHTLMAMSNAAFGYDMSHLSQAIQQLEEVRRLCEKHFAVDDPFRLVAMDNLSDFYSKAGRFTDAISIEIRVVDLRKEAFGEEDPETITAMNNLASRYAAAYRREKALELREKVLKLRTKVLGAEHPDTVDAMANLARSYAAADRGGEAIELWKRALALSRKNNGEEHAATINMKIAFASGYFDLGRPDEAIKLQDEARISCEALYGRGREQTLKVMSEMATYLFAGKRHDEGIAALEHTISLMKESLGPENRETLIAMGHLGHLYAMEGHLDDAILQEKKVLPLCRKVLGFEDRETVQVMRDLASDDAAQRQWNDALELQEEVVRIDRNIQAPDDPVTLKDANNLAKLYFNLEDYSRAAGLGEQILPLCPNTTAREKKFRFEVIGTLANSCYEDSDFRRSLALYRELLAGEKERHATETDQVKTLSRIGMALIKTGTFAEAEKDLRECLEIRRRTAPDEWTTYNTLSVLGESLMGQKKYEEAESNLLIGYAGMKWHEVNIPKDSRKRLPEAVDRLVMLYTKTEKPEELEIWKKERDRYQAEAVHVAH